MAMRWIKNLFRAGEPGRQEQGPGAGGPDALVRGGFELELSGDFSAAESAYRQAIEADPGHAEAHFFLGRCAYRDKRFDEAIELFGRACELNPDEAVYLFDLGNALRETEQYERALAVFEACGRLMPDYIGARINRAVALIELERHEEAREDLERLRLEMPSLKEALFNLAGIYREYALIEEGVEACRSIRAMTPDHAPTHSNLLMMLHYSTRYDARAIFEEHLRYGEAFARRYLAPNVDPSWPRRLRIGYVSPDFNGHVVMYFFEPILANHDRSRFEVFCYHKHPFKDAVTDRLRSQAEHWVDAEYLTPEDLAERIRADRIDILVDLAGHTAHNALPVLAAKPAPVQVSYLGYPDTTGLPAVDYRISDRFADPPGESDALSVERIVRMPASYFCYRPPHNAPPVNPLPAAAGAITFGCFNNFHKISDAFLDGVARVLAAVPDSRFMLKGRPLSIPHVARKVRERFERAGIAPDRIVLRGWEQGVKEHLAIYNEVDIALDSFPYNGATTTCEALWMGVPVVTLTWDRHAGRAGASLLNAVGLGELVARDVEEYAAICARLASDRARLAALRAGMRERMKGSPLLDEAGFTREFENALQEMWRVYREQSGRRAEREQAAASEHGIEGARRLRAEGRMEEAQSVCAKALTAKPDDLEHLRLIWDLAFDTQRPGMAVDWLHKALATNPDVAEFHYMLGCALQEQNKAADAAAAFECAVQLDPGMAKAHSNLGCVYEASGELEDAVDSYRKAIDADPALAQAIYNLGNAQRRLGRQQEAVQHIRAALKIDPQRADWSCNLGELLAGQNQLDEAIACFRAAIALAPDYAPAHSGLGAAQAAAGRLDEAIAAFASAGKLAKEDDSGVGSWPLWLALHRYDGEAIGPPAAWAGNHLRELVRTTAHPRRFLPAARRLHVACLLPDPGWSRNAPFVEALVRGSDPDRVLVTCYAGHAGLDEDSTRLKQAGCRWRDLSGLSMNDAALWIRADGIDVLLDTGGHAPGGRPGVLARGPAPVQAAWAGYPGELCLASVPYRISDPVLDPPDRPPQASAAQVVSLDRSAFCYAPPADAPEAGALPLLSSGHVMFGTLAELTCLTPEAIQLWARVLREVPGARLLVGGPALQCEGVRHSIVDAFVREGIAGERIGFAATGGSVRERLEAYRRTDIVLDGFPWAGTVSSCEALWMGVPVISLKGRSRQSRVGASILGCAGLESLVARDPSEYVSIAAALAADPARLGELRATLRTRLRASPLLDANGFARSMEQAFRYMLGQARAVPQERDAA